MFGPAVLCAHCGEIKFRTSFNKITYETASRCQEIAEVNEQFFKLSSKPLGLEVNINFRLLLPFNFEVYHNFIAVFISISDRAWFGLAFFDVYQRYNFLHS